VFKFFIHVAFGIMTIT